MELIDFGPLRVAVDDRVLMPRQWTLLQAQWAVELAEVAPAGRMAEICSGAGQIGQAAALLTGRDIVQVDIDPHACALATANAARNGLAGRVEVRCADLDDALDETERFPIVLSDAPYLPAADVDGWPADPQLAVDGGGDGLALQRRCLRLVGAHLSSGGLALVQTWGRRQVDALAGDMARAGLRCREVREIDPERAVALLAHAHDVDLA